ncbi:MAG: zinc metallopeptidase [Kiritimatiellia bacterium]
MFTGGYLVFFLPAMILSVIASALTSGTFKKYARVAASSGMTGGEAARRLLASEGIDEVSVNHIGGFLTDHYHPVKKELNLSDQVYNSNSLSAIGVACHEAGHALQHAQGYGPLMFRSALVPVTQFSSKFSYFVLILGLAMNFRPLVDIGIILFSLAVLFSLVTLPVEWNASARAKKLMVSSGIVSAAEEDQAGKVLNAAFMTYVAAAVSSIMTLLYYISRRR